MKYEWLTSPKMWKWLFFIHLAVVALCVTRLAMDETWDNWSIANAGLAGIALSSAWHAHQTNRLTIAFALMQTAYHQLNKAFNLLANEYTDFREHVMETRYNVPTAPEDE